MKTTISSIVMVIASITTIWAQAPSLTFADFPFATQNIPYDYMYKSTAVPQPTVGTNQTWNYGNQTGGTANNFVYQAQTAPQLPALTHLDFTNFEPIAGGLGLDYTALIGLNSSGFQVLGRQYPPQRYGIGGLSGNNLDSLTLDLQTFAYPTPGSILKFPMTMGTAWTNTLRRTLMMKLTLNNYGIVNTDFEKRSREVRLDTVVGWGDVITPAGTGASVPYRCLLVNHYTTVSDSFYLGGAPAPAALLQAFGLSQNQKTYGTRHLFWRANEIFPQMQFVYGSANFTNPTGFSRNLHGQQAVATESRNEANSASLHVFPNPSTGEQFQIVPSKQEPMRLTVTNIAGSVVAEFQLGASSNTVEIPLTPMLPKGVYVVNVEYTVSKTREQTKLIVQ